MKIKINGRNIEYFTGLSINYKLDSIASTFQFVARFNPENDNHKEIFKPLQFYKVEIYNDNDNLRFTGIILNHKFKSDSKNNLVAISGYSLPGILEDVTIPRNLYPLESLNRSFKDIAARLCNAYGIGLVIDKSVANEVNRIYKKTVASPTDTVKSYLSKLASQRNILMSHNEKGQLVLFKPNDKAQPKLFLNKENSISMDRDFNGQGMHSDIVVVRQPSSENAGVSTADSIKNPLIGKYRPTTKVLSSGEDTDTSKAANNELSSELKNLPISVELEGLFEDLKCGDIVNIHNHEIYSFAYTRYMINDITLNKSEKEERTSIKCVLPETYTGNIPRNILFYYESHKREN